MGTAKTYEIHLLANMMPGGRSDVKKIFQSGCFKNKTEVMAETGKAPFTVIVRIKSHLACQGGLGPFDLESLSEININQCLE